MIAGAELAAWFADRKRQADTQEAAQAFALRWTNNPLFDDLRSTLADPDRSSSSLEAAAQRLMASDETIESLFRELLEASAADPFFRPPLRTVANDIHKGILLFIDPAISISLGVIDIDALAAKKSEAREDTRITFTGQRSILKFIKAGGAILSFWEADAIDPGFVAHENLSCRMTERRTIADGETIILDGRSQSFVIELAVGDIVCLQALINEDIAPLAVSYDSRLLQFAAASSGDEAASRTQMMVTLLRVMDRTDAIPYVRQALASPHFYTRWHVMRELLAMDAEAALPCLRDMARADPHPEIRATARQTLEQLFGETLESEEAEPCLA